MNCKKSELFSKDQSEMMMNFKEGEKIKLLNKDMKFLMKQGLNNYKIMFVMFSTQDVGRSSVEVLDVKSKESILLTDSTTYNHEFELQNDLRVSVLIDMDFKKEGDTHNRVGSKENKNFCINEPENYRKILAEFLYNYL